MQISADKIKIPVVFYNLKGYDSHFIMYELGELIKKGEDIPDNVYIKNKEGKMVKDESVSRISVSVIAQNAEKYMAFYIGKHLSFIDSFAFMSSSLDELAGNLEDRDFIYTKDLLLPNILWFPHFLSSFLSFFVVVLLRCFCGYFTDAIAHVR